MEVLSAGEITLRVAGALLCGALVGLERERKHRPAGFRTMILISLGSCGFILLSIQAVAHISDEAIAHWPPGVSLPGQAELSRAIQGLMGGIGFLGAGAVIQNKKAVRGLTTAAAVWVVAALGAASAFGFYKLVVILGAATLFTLVVLDVFENRYFPDPDEWKLDTKKPGKPASTTNGNGNGHHPELSDAGYGPAKLRGEEYEEANR